MTGWPALTEREREALEHLAQGLTVAEIGQAMHVSAPAAKNHLKAMRGKLGAVSGPHAVHLAYQAGLLKREVPGG